MTGVVGVASSLGVSILVNIASIWYQNNKRKERERIVEQKNWYRDLLQTCRNLERVAYLISPTADSLVGREGFQSEDPNIKQVDELLTELEGLVDKKPENLEADEVSQRIADIEAWHKRNQDNEPISSIDIKERVIEDSRFIKDIAESRIPE